MTAKVYETKRVKGIKAIASSGKELMLLQENKVLCFSDDKTKLEFPDYN
jgi:hypothetical protein